MIQLPEIAMANHASHQLQSNAAYAAEKGLGMFLRTLGDILKVIIDVAKQGFSQFLGR